MSARAQVRKVVCPSAPSLLKSMLGFWAEWSMGMPVGPSSGAIALTWAVKPGPMMAFTWSEIAFWTAVTAAPGSPVLPSSYALYWIGWPSAPPSLLTSWMASSMALWRIGTASAPVSAPMYPITNGVAAAFSLGLLLELPQA